MSQDLRVVRERVGRLVRRERALLGLEVGGQAALLAAVVLLVGLAAAAMRWDRGLAAAVVVALVGIGAWVAVAWPLLAGWRRAGDPVRQARLVEGLAPGLRGRLVTAVERVDGPRGQESPALLGLVARRAVELSAGVRPGEVHPVRGAAVKTAAAVATWVAVACAGLVLPQGFGGAAAWWLAGGTADAAMDVEAPEDPETARVGDITLRYVYPEYTGLDPLVVPNNTGDAHGLPGTVVEVELRTGEAVETAALVAYDEPPLEATVVEGRVVQGAFTIQTEPGTWHLLLYHRGVAEPSEEFAIDVEPDLPPEVTLDAEQAVYELAVDDVLPLRWQARDDYGVSRVEVEVNERVVGAPLVRTRGRRAEVTDVVRLRPADLGLRPGDRADLRLAAWDNDTWSGSKAGRSAPVGLVILGAKGLDDRNDERYRDIRGALLDVLADHLEEPWPAGDTSGEMAAWGEELARRYRRFDALVDNYERVLRTDALDARVVIRVSRAGRELIRYTQLSFQPGSDARLADADYEVPAQLRDDAIGTLENGILALDRTIRNRALAEVARLAQELESTADHFQAMLEEEDASVQEMLARLDQLERMLTELAQQAAALDEGGLKEFANQRTAEMSNLLDEIRKAIAAGDMDEARELMSRMEEMIRQLSEGVQDRVEARQQASEQMTQAAESVLDELEALEKEQRELASELHGLQERLGAEDLAAAEDLWEEIEREASALGRGTEELAAGLREAGRSFHERNVAEAVASDAERLEDAVRNRDLGRSRMKVEDVRYSLRKAENAILWMEDQRGGGRGPGVGEVAELQRRAREIARLLDELESTQGDVDPELAREMREMAGEQEALQERLDRAARQAEQVAATMPIRPEGVGEALDEAQGQMEDAEQGLRRARPMAAEGAQGAAAERIRDARESMRQAMEDMARSSMPMPGQGEREGRRRSEGQEGQHQNDFQAVEIPSPEEFMTPEAYRRALLEGMEGEVPAEYRALKKRYYEELVNQ